MNHYLRMVLLETMFHKFYLNKFHWRRMMNHTSGKNPKSTKLLCWQHTTAKSRIEFAASHQSKKWVCSVMHRPWMLLSTTNSLLEKSNFERLCKITRLKNLLSLVSSQVWLPHFNYRFLGMYCHSLSLCCSKITNLHSQSKEIGGL